MQLEQKIKEILLATFNISEINAANPPNKLNLNKIIQGRDKEKWSQGMGN